MEYTKNAVIIIGIGRIKQISEALYSVKEYCSKYNLELEVINTPKWNFGRIDNYNYQTFEKNQIYDYFNKYDRILRLDSDVIIKPNCPNLFLNEPGKFYVSYEDKNKRKYKRKEEIKIVKKSLGDIDNWDEGYFNSGVILCDKDHKDAFSIELNEIYENDLGSFKEQTYLNWKVRNLKFDVVDLGPQFNYTVVHEGYYDKKDAWILHYAGKQTTKIYKMRIDNLKYYKKGGIFDKILFLPYLYILFNNKITLVNRVLSKIKRKINDKVIKYVNR